MRKYSLFVLAAALIGGVTTAASAPAAPTPPKVGSACTKAGAFFDTPNVRYVCNVEGKKKVWRVWHPASAPKPATSMSNGSTGTQQSGSTTTTATPAAPAAPKAVVNPIPLSLPVAPIGAITFDNITQHISDISTAAYNAVQAVESANPQPDIPNTIAIGPTTVPSVPDVAAAYKKIEKLWAGFRQPSTNYALVFNYQDKAWAVSNATANPVVIANGGINGPLNLPNRIEQGCSAVNQCSGANSGISDAAGNSVAQFGMDPVMNSRDPYFQTGGIFGHEYTHSVQAAQFLGNPKIGTPDSAEQRAHGLSNQPSGLYEGVVPCWFAEGQPNFNGTAAEASSLSDYLRWRSGMPKGFPTSAFPDYSAAAIQNLLLTDNPPNCLPPAEIYRVGYGIGALVIEALTAIAGPQSTMSVVTEQSYGKTFPEAFQIVYGISWDKAAPILAQVAATEYAAVP